MIGTVIHFTIPGEPKPKERARKGNEPGSQFHTPKETKKYEEAVGLWALQARCKTKEWDVRSRFRLDVIFYFPTWRKDCSNVLKAIEDGCNGILWHDDSHKYLKAGSFDSEVDRENPRVEVTVTIVGDPIDRQKKVLGRKTHKG